MTWQTVIGLEIHAQLKTASKLFSSADSSYGASPNSHTSFIDAGLPGVLPVLNHKAINMAIQFGLAINAEINDLSYFERKNYFYPDLPKGYQISQFQRPIVSNGEIEIYVENKIKKIIIERAHLEEDAGKSIHDMHELYTAIDLNRAGTPLLEIVTTPCMYSAAEAIAYLKTIHQLVRFLDICDGNMQEGSFRCDVNLSLRKKGVEKLGTRTELKNLNSFRFIEKAIAYEQNRHQDLLESGQNVTQETRLYCPNTDRTEVLRSKENENDYRYFPDPDLLPIKISSSLLKEIKESMPELPAEIIKRLEFEDKISFDDIEFLLSSPIIIKFYDKVKSLSHADAKTIVNWLKGTYSAALNAASLSFDQAPVPEIYLAELLNKLTDNKITSNIAKSIFAKLMIKLQPIDELMNSSGFDKQIDNNLLEDIIKEIVKNNPKQVEDFRSGKEKIFSFFVGLVMKQTKGSADPARVNTLLREYLK